MENKLHALDIEIGELKEKSYMLYYEMQQNDKVLEGDPKSSEI